MNKSASDIAKSQRRGMLLRVGIGIFVGVAISKIFGDGRSFDTACIVALAALLIFLTIRVVFAIRAGDATVKRRYAHIDIPMGIVQIGMLIPLIWVLSSVMEFADYPAPAALLYIGGAFYLVGLYIVYRAHADLGKGLSATLDIKEDHQLITRGIYSRVRNPMYLGFILYALGQLLVIPNVVAAPSALIGFTLLIALRLPSEEAMLRDEFGEAFDAYAEKTKRVFPGVW